MKPTSNLFNLAVLGALVVLALGAWRPQAAPVAQAAPVPRRRLNPGGLHHSQCSRSSGADDPGACRRASRSRWRL